MHEVVVVGSGIAGLSLAYHLAKRGADVALVGPVELSELVGESTAGILTYHMREPFSDWALRTYELYLELGESVVEKTDTLWILGDEELAREVAEKASTRGLGLREASEAEVAEATGGRVRLAEGEVAFLGDGLRYSVRKLHRAFLKKLSELETRVVSGWAELRDGAVVVDGEEVRGEKIVVACGPWTREMLSLTNLTIYKCQLAKIRPELEIAVLDDVLGFYYNTLPSGEAVVGDGVEIMVDSVVEAMEPDREVVQSVLSKAAKRGVVSSQLAEAKPISAPCIGTSDGHPVAGRVRDNIFVLTGFDGVGYSIAPAVAELLALHLLEGSELPSYLSPERRLREGRVLEPIDMA